MSVDEYVPSDEDVYGVWLDYQCFRADDGYGPRGIERAAAEMDRYIARVRRDAAREAMHALRTHLAASRGYQLIGPEGLDYYIRNHHPEETP